MTNQSLTLELWNGWFGRFVRVAAIRFIHRSSLLVMANAATRK